MLASINLVKTNSCQRVPTVDGHTQTFEGLANLLVLEAGTLATRDAWQFYADRLLFYDRNQ